MVQKLDFVVSGEPVKARVVVDGQGEAKVSLSGLELPAGNYLDWDTVDELARMFAELQGAMSRAEVAHC